MKRLYKGIMLIVFVIVLLVLSGIQVFADVGPKPSVSIHVSGIEGTYYVTLLSEVKSTGPYSADYPYVDQDIDFTVFENYDDEFYFLYNAQELEGEGTYSWSYYPPEVYKVLIYIPSTASYLESEVLTSFAFDSHYRVEVANNEIVKVSKQYDYIFNAGDYALRLGMTLIIEVLIALMFRFRGRDLKVIVITNVITQTLLIAILIFANYQIGYLGELFTMIPIELVILATEIIIYRRYLDPAGHPVIYAFVANIASFAAGMWLLIYLVS